jgi:hypothetical protein
MDFNKAIELAISSSEYINLNTITAAPTVGTPFSGYVVESVSYANAGIVGFTGALAQRDGFEADIALVGARQVQMIVQVYGSSEADFYDKLNALNSSLSPYPEFALSDDGFRNLRFSQSTISNAGYSSSGVIPLRIKVRPQAIPSYTLNNDLVTARTSDRGVSTKASITFVAKDPRKLSQTDISGSLSSSTVLTNNGNYNAYPTITLVSTAAQTATISTSSWTVSVSISSGTTTTVIDGVDRRILVNGVLNMSKLQSTTTRMPIIYPGAQTVTLSSTASLTNITATYSYAEAWL